MKIELIKEGVIVDKFSMDGDLDTIIEKIKNRYKDSRLELSMHLIRVYT